MSFLQEFQNSELRIQNFVFLLLTATTALAQTAPSTATAPATMPAAIQGSWTTPDHKNTIRFSPTHIYTFEQGALNILPIKQWQSDRVVVSAGGRRASFRYKLADDKLVISPDGLLTQSSTYTKLDKTPPELEEPQPLPLGKPHDLAPDQLRTIQTELAARLTKDQAVRQPGKTNPAEMQKIDADNTAYLKTLLADHGWIDTARFGQEANLSAFLIVQHSGDLPLMLAALPELEKETKAKATNNHGYALLFDRTQLRLGHKQRYGSQIGMNDKGQMVVLPLEDPANVDTLRKQVGLGPLADYLKQFSKMSGKPVEILTDN